MAESTKMASSFDAWVLKVGVKPHNLESALERCRELGLAPNPCGFQEGYVLFRVMLPESSKGGHDARHAFMKEADAFHGGIFHGARTRLICPTKAA